MGLSGSLLTFPLDELLQWMGSSRKTGTLILRGRRHTKRIYIKEGRIISSASDDPTEQLGQFLLSRGRITEEDLRRGLETQAKTRVLLGKILLMVGAIKEDELRRMLVMQAEETIFSLFLWSDAAFELLDGDLPSNLFAPISLDVQDVLLKGHTMVDALSRMHDDLGSAASVPAKTGKPLPAGQGPDHRLRAMVLDLVDGARSIEDIGLALHASEFTVCKLLHQLYEQGHVAVKHKAAPAPEDSGPGDRPPDSPEVLLARGRERLASGRSEEAIEILQQALAATSRDLELQNLYDAACRDFREKAYGRFLPPTSIPTLIRGLDTLTGEALTPEEVFLISRIDGTWDLKSIIDISPLAEVDALRIMKRLKDRRIIELK